MNAFLLCHPSIQPPTHAPTCPFAHWTFPEELPCGPSFRPALSTLSFRWASPLPASLLLFGILIFFHSHLRPHHLSLPPQCSLLPPLLPLPAAPTPAGLRGAGREPVLWVWLGTELAHTLTARDPVSTSRGSFPHHCAGFLRRPPLWYNN